MVAPDRQRSSYAKTSKAQDHRRLRALAACTLSVFCGLAAGARPRMTKLDDQLMAMLREAGFSGRVQSTLESRLRRPVESELANLGRLLFFDKVLSLHSDNACAGCHSPSAGFGDTQSIAIGIQNNNVVGRHRSGPRNQRRTPMIVNAVFFPSLMWNGRFFAASGDPFDNSLGFVFPPPEGTTQFQPRDPIIKTLLAAQAHLPPTELVEVAGFTGTTGTIDPLFDQFDDGEGSVVPPPDESGFRNEPIRRMVLQRLDASPAYRSRFGRVFPAVAHGGSIDFTMVARAIAEFEFTLVFADAPIDRFARGESHAMSAAEKRGALLFFGKAGCVTCHAVAGPSNEMFSDFQMHAIGVPQIAPRFGAGAGNVIFDGPNQNEDFGLEQVTANHLDRYKFRSSPLRNVSLQPAFFHNGAFTRLEDAIDHHLDVVESARNYDPIRAGVGDDLTFRLGPIEPLLANVDPLLMSPSFLTQQEFEDLVVFVKIGLLDSRVARHSLCSLIPSTLPSGMPPLRVEECPQR
jgi:cytochrome c peroxidase